MENIGYIEIIVQGKEGERILTPDDFDIKELKFLFEQVEALLFPEGSENRPIISFRIEEGSVKNIFKTHIQYVIAINALLMEITKTWNLSFLEPRTAEVFKAFLKQAQKKDYTFQVSTSIINSPKLCIDKTTSFFFEEEYWVDSEFYFYGTIVDAGGKDKANIHLDTQDYGLLRIQTPREYLEKIEKNILYKTYGVRIRAKQNLRTGEFDKQNLVLLDLVEYEPSFDKNYLDNLQNKAKGWIEKIDPENWLREIRGYDA